MGRQSSSPPGTHVYAHLFSFDCECPGCGRLVSTGMDRRTRSAKAQEIQLGYRSTSQRFKGGRLKKTVWNPVTQVLQCPYCGRSYMLGLLIYSLPLGLRRPLEAPLDTILPVRTQAAIRQLGGGRWVEQVYARDAPVNVLVETPCSCPINGWAAECAVHGSPAQPASR